MPDSISIKKPILNIDDVNPKRDIQYHLGSLWDTIVSIKNLLLNGNIKSDLTGNVTGNLTGDVTGNLNGNVKGNVIGNVTGNLTGDVGGNGSVQANYIYSEYDVMYTSIKSGWSFISSSITRFERVGNLVYAGFRIEGTGDANPTYFTLPYQPRSNSAYSASFVYEWEDGGGLGFGFGYVQPLSNLAILHKTTSYGGFSGSGTKKVHGSFVYLI